jgi:hypothetical protein
MGGRYNLHGVIDIYTKFWFESIDRRKHSEDPGLDGKIILREMLRKCDVRLWTGLIWSRMVTDGVLL